MDMTSSSSDRILMDNASRGSYRVSANASDLSSFSDIDLTVIGPAVLRFLSITRKIEQAAIASLTLQRSTTLEKLVTTESLLSDWDTLQKLTTQFTPWITRIEAVMPLDDMPYPGWTQALQIYEYFYNASQVYRSLVRLFACGLDESSKLSTLDFRMNPQGNCLAQPVHPLTLIQQLKEECDREFKEIWGENDSVLSAGVDTVEAQDAKNENSQWIQQLRIQTDAVVEYDAAPWPMLNNNMLLDESFDDAVSWPMLNNNMLPHESVDQHMHNPDPDVWQQAPVGSDHLENTSGLNPLPREPDEESKASTMLVFSNKRPRLSNLTVQPQSRSSRTVQPQSRSSRTVQPQSRSSRTRKPQPRSSRTVQPQRRSSRPGQVTDRFAAKPLSPTKAEKQTKKAEDEAAENYRADLKAALLLSLQDGR
jgi:hypothetical protein